MSRLRYYRLLIIGFLLVVAGVVIPFLTIMGTIPSNLFILFASYAGSVVGVALALIWSAGFVRERRDHDR
jgi:heme/copper-type cytochrome/quinol oxidase subunit 4